MVALMSLFFYNTLKKSYPNAVQGVVLSYSHGKENNNKSYKYNYVDVKITSGSHKDKKISVQNFSSGHIKSEDVNTGNFAEPGDEVLLNLKEDSKGNIESAYIFEIVRYKHIYKLVSLFVIILLLIGGLKGLKSIVALIFTGVIVIKVMIPLILIGVDPIKLSIAICILVTIVNLILISGKNKKTFAAIIGTLGGLFISGAIAIFSNSVIKVKGLTDEEIKFLTYVSRNPNFNFGGLLFAGIIMGALGAVMDVSISIASSMKEIKEANPEIGTRELIKSGMTIGQDIIGSMSNTLILAYVGGAMYLMIMISSNGMDFCRTINQDIIASEILRALAGSIGLIFSVPLTAIVYALFEKFNIDIESFVK
ncbi:YibE/F family protein [Clostridium acetireducens]|uniref:YibE/F family protein n=1 Tax=Clostridium acetireducens TaxID=76489 RepID=UPI001FA809B2|nr:YibE/F family protein [Clostridium acetireducens]